MDFTLCYIMVKDHRVFWQCEYVVTFIDRNHIVVYLAFLNTAIYVKIHVRPFNKQQLVLDAPIIIDNN